MDGKGGSGDRDATRTDWGSAAGVARGDLAQKAMEVRVLVVSLYYKREGIVGASVEERRCEWPRRGVAGGAALLLENVVLV